MVTLLLCLLTIWAEQYKTMYFSQPLDHVNRKSGTISIKALVREGDPDGLMFVYTGNEAPIELFYDMTGWLVDYLGPYYNATVAFIEHRYYGYSKPTQPDNYQFLDTTQALWDFADITLQLKPKQTTRVIAIGGSYGGMLSAMFRLKFPYLVDGAIASSAPLLMGTLTGNQFNNVVTVDYQSAGSDCAKIIWQSFEILDELTNRELYYKTLELIYRPCMSISDPEHVDDLKYYLYDAIEGTAQYAYPYPTNVYGLLPGYPMQTVCSILENHFSKENIWDAMNGMYQIMDLYYNATGSSSCFDVYQSEKPTKSAWEYQTCTQLLMPIGQYGWPVDMFPKEPWDYDAFVASCNEKYGVEPRLSWEKVNYGMTTEYKNTLQYMTNIVFSYGTNDPWKVGCFQDDFDGDQNLVVGITGASHHYDLRQPNPLDTYAVINVRAKEQSLIEKWAGFNQYGL